MGLFNRKKTEKRAFDSMGQPIDAADVLLQALLGTTAVTRAVALNVPTLSGAIEYIGNTTNMVPIKLYKDVDGKIEEVKNDPRVALLNDDPKDTLTAADMRKALVRDYFLGKGGYLYIDKYRNEVRSLRYVRECEITVNKNTDPIFKDYDILVNGKPYKPFDFVKVLRNTEDGAQGASILSESDTPIRVAYNTLVFENTLVSTGGNKKGFLKSEFKLEQAAIDALKAAWKRLYANNEENIVILNKGLEFQEASNSSVEMQLNENKQTNANEICRLLNVPESIIKGTAKSDDYITGFKLAVQPFLDKLISSINRDLLLEKEKKAGWYFAYDAKELLKGDIKSRYDAYKTGIEANVIQIDEARYMEDLPPLGLNFIKLGLDAVLYDPKTKTVFTPNTGQVQDTSAMTGNDPNGQPQDNTKGGDVGADRNQKQLGTT